MRCIYVCNKCWVSLTLRNSIYTYVFFQHVLHGASLLLRKFSVLIVVVGIFQVSLRGVSATGVLVIVAVSDVVGVFTSMVPYIYAAKYF